MTADLDEWMSRLAERHMAELVFAEVVRALRAVSSAYVERRDTAMRDGRILHGAGKRAAFALYYGPLHFLAARRVLADLPPGPLRSRGIPVVTDLGCGTGAVGAAAALQLGARRVHGIDVHPWALDEAQRTYAVFGLDGSVSRRDVARVRLTRGREPSLVVAGYVVNELAAGARDALQRTLANAVRRGSGLLIIEPLSGRAAPWWPAWADAFGALGARADSWTLDLDPPDLTRRLGEAAGLTPASVKLRTIALL